MNTNAETTHNEATATTADVAEQGTPSAPEQATSTKKATSKKGAPKGQKAAAKKEAKRGAKAASKKAAKASAKPAAKKDAKPAGKKAFKAAAPKEGSVPREFSKKAIVLDLIRRKDGATLAEIAKATGWQNHSIRGFISGTVAKKMDLAVASLKNEKGERVYKIEK